MLRIFRYLAICVCCIAILLTAGASHLGHAYQNQDLSYLEHKTLHAALGAGAGAITGKPIEGGVGGLVGEVTAEAVVKARATSLLYQMLERKITPEQLQTGLAKLRQDASDIAKLTGATTAFAGKMDIDATTASAGTAADNNAVTPLDALFIGADLAKIGVAYYQDDQALMEEAIKDLATDIIPGVPAGTSRVAKLLASGAKSAYKHVDTKVAKEKHLPSLDTKVYTEKEAMHLSGENKGLIYVAETPRGSKSAQEFQAGTTGAFSDVAHKKEAVPALRYNNTTSPNGKNYIKFDGIEKAPDGTTIMLIDAKKQLPTWNKGAMDQLGKTLDRVDSALKQNPEFKVVYEFPNNKAADNARKFLKDKDLSHVVQIRVRGE